MGRKYSSFTQEDIRILKENPNTSTVTKSRLTITLEAKKIVLELHQAGWTSRRIVEELGYDPKMLGEQRMKNMVAVYTLMNVDRGVPEVWGSLYDVRDLLKATISMRDGRPLSEMKLGLKEKAAMHELLKKIHGTDIEKLLMEYHVIG